MGKKNKKTRWRTLTLNGHQSDSEESNSKSSLQTSKGYQHKYSKFPYSSQSSPIRKFQHESSKSTRSNSTTSEHKTTFNEDEYTRITTPRQDVLFKKGYLNKPKTYQTQTSTGTSSTANSTSTCTPDHQSADGTEGTDLEYESQFVFPNGFIDRNGIYYINSFEPFPFVVYNAPICYPEYPNTRSKRYSTDSMTESVSPHNEEVGQELSQNGAGERINNTPVFSQTYMQPAYYFNGVNTLTNGQYTIEEARRFKKRRRRKISRSKSNHDGETSQDTDDYASSDEVFSQSEDHIEPKRLNSLRSSSSTNHSQPNSHPVSEELPKEEVGQSEIPIVENENLRLTNGIAEDQSSHESINLEGPPQVQESNKLTHPIEEDQTEEENPKPSSNDAQNLLLQSLLKNSDKDSETSTSSDQEQPLANLNSISDLQDCSDEPKEAPSLDHVNTYSLKPDAEEFIPRTFRAPEAFPYDPNVQFLNIPSNFIPIPFVNHLGELQQPPFLPPGIPLNFVQPQDPKLLPNFVNIVPNDGFVPKTFEEYPEAGQDQAVEKPEEKITAEESQKEPEASTKTEAEPEPEMVQPKKPLTKNEIDIAKIVSKLEEAAMQQRVHETKPTSPKYSSKPYANQRTKYPNRNYQENHYGENKYHQRNRPNNSEKQYERRYRRPEQNFRRERSKTNFETEIRPKSETRSENPAPEVIEDRLQTSSRHSTPVRIAQINLEGERKPEMHSQKLETPQSMQKPVNNVNTRIGESCSMTKDLKLEGAVNYSETLKKKIEVVQNNTNKCQRYEKHNSEKIAKKSEQILVQISSPKPQKAPNQWISVSSRKKRKNKTVNEEKTSVEEQEQEQEEEKEIHNDDHLFETFDVNMLEDVVPPSQVFDPNLVQEPLTQEEIPVVAETEDSLSLGEEEKVNLPEIVEESAKTIPNVEEIEDIQELEIIVETPKENVAAKSIRKLNEGSGSEKKKKKSQKGTQKPFTKRIIITDVNLELTKAVPKEDLEAKTEPEGMLEELKDKEEISPTLKEEEKGIVIEDQIPILEVPQEICMVEEVEVSKAEEINIPPEEIEKIEVHNGSLEVMNEESEDNVKEITKCEETPTKLVEPIQEILSSSPNYQTQTSESDTVTETPEKKSKRKKKKTPKPTLVKIQSVSSSTTTLNNLDESYDFLLETSILEDSEQKTNVEMSQELDRMIQKGMYSSLEEKIRTLKISATDDGFFKTINYLPLQNQANPENPNIIKAANFGKMIRNTTQLLKMPKTSEEIDQQNLINIDFSSIKLPDLEPQPSTSKSGIFLENPEVNELIKNATNNTIDPSLKTLPQTESLGKTKDNGKLKNKSKKKPHQPKPEIKEIAAEVEGPQKGEENIDQESKNLTTSNTFSAPEVEPPVIKSPPKQDSLYPITQAVKDWMSRTREHTPDVEILKSPNTIYKEFYDTESDSTGDSKNDLNGSEAPQNGLGNPKSVSRESSPLPSTKPSGKRPVELSHTGNEDEITIWSVSPQNSVEEDLLDCWENDLTNGCEEKNEEGLKKNLTNGLPGKKNILIQNGGIKEIKGSVQNGHQAQLNGHVEEGEEAIEVYESKYGKNEDFLKLKAEIEEQQSNGNFPKHGNLPYRAICCSIM